MKEEEGFLRRWSQRKRAEREDAAEAGAEGLEAVPEVAVGEGGAEPVPESAPEPDALTPEEVAALPPVEMVSDLVELRRYLSKGVPDLMRRAALRRIWRLDPRIRDHVDVALDYAYDWNTPGGVPGSGALVSRAGVARMADALFTREPGRPEQPGAAVAAPDLPRRGVTEGRDEPAGTEAAPVVAEAAADPLAPAEAAPAEETAPGTTGNDDPEPRWRRGHGGATPV
jgi:hypothetical protein